MDYSTLGVLSILVILVVLILITVPVRRRPALRRIEAYEMMPDIVGRTVEADRPLHISLGSAGIGGESTMIAVVGASLAYQLALRAAVGDHSPLITASDTSAIPLAQDALRRAYRDINASARYNPSAARWYPSGGRSLAFAAALSVMLSDERVGGSVLAGSHGAEVALVMNTSSRMGQPIIAVSDRLEGQAVAYVMGDAPLIGEEVFVAPAYLDENPSEARLALTLDMMRYLLIAAMLVILVLSARG